MDLQRRDAPAKDGPIGLSRRTLVAAAAWSAPVIVMASATPAMAASDVYTIKLDAPTSVTVNSVDIPTTITLRKNGLPMAGQTVLLATSDANIATWGMVSGAQDIAVITGADGVAKPTDIMFNALCSRSTLGVATLTARFLVSGQVVASSAVNMTVIARPVLAPTGSTIFDPSDYTFTAGATNAVLTGRLNRQSGSGYPSSVRLAFPVGLSGPATVSPDANGYFSVALTAVSTPGGSVEAAADGFGAASAVVTVNTPAQPSSGTISFDQTSYVVAANAVGLSLGGRLNRQSGSGYPTEVSILYGAGTGIGGPSTAPVDQATGLFAVRGVSVGSVDGVVTASASGYGDAQTTLQIGLSRIIVSSNVQFSPNGFVKGNIDLVAGGTMPKTVTLTFRPTTSPTNPVSSQQIAPMTVNVGNDGTFASGRLPAIKKYGDAFYIRCEAAGCSRPTFDLYYTYMN